MPNDTATPPPTPTSTPTMTPSVIGLDLGSRRSHACVVDRSSGEVRERFELATTQHGLRARFSGRARSLVVLEASGPSPWVSRLLRSLGHDVHVAHAQRLALISKSQRKTDRQDAELLARIGRSELGLLGPGVTHRSEEKQAHMEVLRARDALVRTRTLLINHVRGALKSMGAEIPGCTAEAFHHRLSPCVPKSLQAAIQPLLDQIEGATTAIRQYDAQVDALAEKHYPITGFLRAVNGVGPLTSMAFALVIDDPGRFRSSRSVGSYLGLAPARDQSGDLDPQLHITKAGDTFLRRLLVNSAQYMLGPFGKDSALRRGGLALMRRGGKNAKRRAVVAVARKLAVLLHRLWTTGEVYDAMRNARQLPEPASAPA